MPGRLLVILLILLLAVGSNSACASAPATPPAPMAVEPAAQGLQDPLGPAAPGEQPGPTTPELIFQALANGEIDEDTAYLYLAYALAGSDLLPERFISDAPWSGTMWELKLRDVLPAIRSPDARNAIQALLTGSCSTSSGTMPDVLNSTHQGIISALNNSYSGNVEDNYALNWVQSPTGSQQYNAYLISSGATDLRASLVCDTGSQFCISAFYESASTTDTTWVKHFDPAGCTSIIVVITNEWTTSGNPTSCGTTAYQVQATNVIYVNHAVASPGYGASAKPYLNVASGAPDVPGDGVLSIAAGSYDETVIINTPMTVQATGGTATIGQ